MLSQIRTIVTGLISENHSLFEDALQEGVVAWLECDGGEDPTEAVLSHVSEFLKKERSYQRQHRQIRPSDQPGALALPPDPYLESVGDDVISKLDVLDEIERKIFVLVHGLEGGHKHTIRAAAKEVGLSSTVAFQRLRRAQKKLRKIFSH